MDGLARLTAIEAIKVLKARYFRAVDTRDWALLRNTFTEDVTLDYRGAADDESGHNTIRGPTETILHGADAAVETVRRGLESIATIHHGHMPEIEIISDRTARAVWAMYDLLIFPPGGDIAEMTGYGHYHETYLLQGDEWRIASLRLTRLRTVARRAEII